MGGGSILGFIRINSISRGFKRLLLNLEPPGKLHLVNHIENVNNFTKQIVKQSRSIFLI